MKEETNKILEKLNNTKEIIKIKKLNKKLNNNQEYLSLMSEFIKNKDDYIKNNTYNDELINLRKKLFSIEELNEYLKLQNNLRLLFTKINNEILSLID
jgi:hypothetical protein